MKPKEDGTRNQASAQNESESNVYCPTNGQGCGAQELGSPLGPRKAIQKHSFSWVGTEIYK